MNRILTLKLLLAAVLAMLTSTSAMAKTVQVGTCQPGLQSYSTISQAVSAVPSGSTILVCPGTYPEQVTITQPLTLQGVQSGNSGNPTITVPAGGLIQSVTSPVNGVTIYFQILVQGTEAELVNISNLGVNGSNNLVSCTCWIAGIYYQNSSGKVKNAATYNQMGNGYGFGMFVDSSSTTPKTIGISTSSIHDFDAEAIRNNGNASITVDIKGNTILVSPSSTYQINGIDVYGVGSITDNSIAAKPGLAAVGNGIGIATESGVTVSNNTIAGILVGIWPLINSNTVTSNRISFATTGIILTGADNNVEYNFIQSGGIIGGTGIDFNCTGTGNTVINNSINDADWGLLNLGGANTVAPNSYANVANLSGGC
jgi:hypothetical protein